jgi:ABC-type nickel/cobalt efflux system permease component RcnA
VVEVAAVSASTVFDTAATFSCMPRASFGPGILGTVRAALRPSLRPAVRAAAIAAGVLLLLVPLAGPVTAHPLGLPAFARISAAADGGATVVWNAAADDVAVLARTVGIDVPEGGLLTREQDAALAGSPDLAAALRDGITLEQDGRACPAEVVVRSLVEEGATLHFACPRPVRDVVVRIALLHEVDERYRTLGIAGTPEGTERVMFTAAAPAHELVLDPASAALIAGGPPASEADVPAAQPFGGSLPFESRFVALIDASAGGTALLVGLLVALGVGAAHGLAPGHGKAVAAAYLVGDRGRPRDAVLLGSVVALMHTWSVLALGFGLYSATQRPATAALSAWLQLVSGALVMGLGAWLLARRLRERRRSATTHAHSAGSGHEHAHGQSDGLGPRQHTHGHGPGQHTHELPADVHPLSWQGLVALGAAGGLLPSPSALLVLLTALAVGRLAYGLGLIAAFSIGLALTVTAVGLAVLRGRDLLRDRAAPAGRLPAVLRTLPLLGAVGVTAIGLVVVVRAAGAVLGA